MCVIPIFIASSADGIRLAAVRRPDQDMCTLAEKGS